MATSLRFYTSSWDVYKFNFGVLYMFVTLTFFSYPATTITFFFDSSLSIHPILFSYSYFSDQNSLFTILIHVLNHFCSSFYFLPFQLYIFTKYIYINIS